MGRMSSVRGKIAQLRRVDLDNVDFNYIAKIIESIAAYYECTVRIPDSNQAFFRGVNYGEKPQNISQLGAPPEECVSNYQRCNRPGFPMFYCTPDLGAIFYELGAKPDEVVYISKWMLGDASFYLNPVESDVSNRNASPVHAAVSSFFEEMFCQKIDQSMSGQYKVTAAIAELLSRRIHNSEKQVGGIVYPSVEHPESSDNVAFYPAVVDKFFSFSYVEELLVKGVTHEAVNFEPLDIAHQSGNGELIWAGAPGAYVLNRGETYTFVLDKGRWIVKDRNGKVLEIE